MNEFEKVKLGALLHDVGKIIQRDMGKRECTHSELGYKFLEGLREDIAIFAKFHHKKDIAGQKFDFERLNIAQQNLLWMVYEADNLSYKEKGETDDEYEPKNPLISIFSSVKGIRNGIDECKIKKRAYPLKPLDFDNFVFPGFGKDRVEDRPHKSYEEIYDDFKHRLPLLHPDLILTFLEKEATFIPAGSGEGEDISLFDHLKTTCAIASCMHIYHKEELDRDIKDKISDKKDEKKYLLISGDISGIQKFIYNITSKGALKLLRARSFFLEMISEDFVQELLDELKLSRANLLYCAGGRFYILAPNKKEYEEIVNKLKNDLNNWLLRKFEGNLYYAVDYIPFKGERFADFSKLWAEISKKLSEQKSKKFRENLVENPGKFLREDLRDENYREKKLLCQACKSFVNELFKDEDKDVEYCEMCKMLKNAGKKLADFEDMFFILRFKETNNQDIDLPFSKIKVVKKIEDSDFNTIFQINSFDIPEEVIKLKTEREFTFVALPLANYSSGKDLDTLAADSYGIQKVGILRMDVDNLGKIFREGLPEEKRTISRITNLSRFLNYFFKGFVNLTGEFNDKHVKGICGNIWGEYGRLQKREKRNFTIVYAGGDDLLLIGSWDETFELAFDINALFRKYVGENDNITISSGFCIFDPKFPFYKMAEISGEKEGLAKDEGRNRIWMFERRIKEGFDEKFQFKESIEWTKFLDVWYDFKLLMNGNNLKVSKGLITKLMTINNAYKEDPTKVSWAIELAYLYGKIEEDKKKYFENIIRKYSVINVGKPSEIYYIDIPLKILDFAGRGG
ncbi:MAG: type III-A CRISPR-associated protein Cas10/Csm1 [Candidatus Methanoperedens sp.]|nr:type III-A CRISPR-associated protein Cas10/Csm1 [Candidatus Methanoperedens sp.]MCZ7405292.1 type III-A CRISPR-associated protein Cas10/Csm1 [Candidatus Methanoperedens sp.]